MPSLDGRAEERFPKTCRLLKRSEFLCIQQKGIKVHSRAFVGLVVFDNVSKVRIGITTTKRIGTAVQRNRLRRIIREAFRRQWMVIPNGSEVVIVAKRNSTEMNSQEIIEDLNFLAKRIDALRR